MKNKSVLMVLASIMSFRMLGLFMILPVFSVYAERFVGATPTLIGLTLGIYGLTQACLQIPFGLLSDRIGRKPVIAIGLFLFMIGSLIAALSHSIYFLMVGRALQGAGAIGSTVLALVADLTPTKDRSKAMAFIGMMIGLSFTIAMIVGPIINHWLHLSGIFWFTALLALIGMSLLLKIPTTHNMQQLPIIQGVNVMLHDKKLLALDFGIFSLHAILTALFIAIPIVLSKQLMLTEWQQIGLYCVVLILSFAIAVPFIIVAEKKKKTELVLRVSVGVMFAVICMFYVLAYARASFILLLIFFAVFTLLEAILPSMVSKIAPPEKKGAAMGIYSASQFLGIFFGGTMGGVVYAHLGVLGVFVFGAAIAGVWFLVMVAGSSASICVRSPSQ